MTLLAALLLATRIQVNSFAESFTGTFMSEVRDVDGNVVFVAHGTVACSRIRPEPSP